MREERRGKPRIQESFPVTVRGVDKRGDAFDIETVVENISASGAYLFIEKRVEERTKLSLVVRFSQPRESKGPAASVAARGVVRRVETKSPGCYGIAIEFRQHRFL